MARVGKPLKDAEIYESNSVTLKTALEKVGYTQVSCLFCNDSLESTLDSLEEALTESDVVISSGGISVGDHDYLGTAFEKLKVEKQFYKVKQKPGKPLYFGRKEDTSIFGLPGNPASALNCLLVYVIPHLNMRSGFGKADNLIIRYPLSKTIQLKGDRSVFLKAEIQRNTVTPLGGQASSMLQSFSEANALIFLAGREEPYQEGELVDVILI